MSTSHEERLTRARCALEGLSVGDALGDSWFFARQDLMPFVPIENRRLPPHPWEYTDDTQMALSIYEILHLYQKIDQDQLVASFAQHFEPGRGYGPAMYRLLPHLRQTTWKLEASNLFNGQGSFGNGGAMRVAPVGAYFADDLQLAAQHAHLSCEVTHTHPEAIAGAIAVAVSAALAWQTKVHEEILTREQFIERVLVYVPESEVREGLVSAYHLPDSAPIWEAVKTLGNGSSIAAQDTVPFCIWCAGRFLNNYEEAIWLTLSGGGDMDTNCAIVGGIVATYTGVEGIPEKWRAYREPLPSWAVEQH